MFRKLSAKISLALIAVMSLLMAAFTIYLVKDRTREMNRLILEKGIAASTIGARITGNMLDSVVDNGIFSIQEVFDRELVPIDLPPSITRKYHDAGIEPKDLSATQKYHYASGMDSYLENLLLPLEDEFLNDPQFAYAALVDINDYLPVHDSIYNRPLTGDFAFDRLNNRTKRIFNDEVGIRASAHVANRYLLQAYRKDTGELMWDISSPVLVKGRHWGAFRVGFSMEKAEKTISSLRNKLILIMGFLLLIMVLVIDRVTVAMLHPLRALHDGVEKVAKGDLSFHQEEISGDEVGDLARAFNKMTESLKVYIKNLQQTTAAKERIESELNIAREIQLSILPKIFPPFTGMPELDLFAVLQSAREVGGDLYDFFAIDDDHFCFVIGDVSGKGVPASLFMAVTKTLFKATAVKDTPPEVVLDRVNNELSKGNEKAMFVTAFFAILNTKTGVVEFANGGHNPPVILRRDGSVQYLRQTGGTVVGAMEGMEFERGTLTLAPGDRFFLYTDGVTEAMDENKVLFSDERLLRELKLLAGLPLKDVLNRLLALLVEYSRGDQSDDITMMLLEYQGPKWN
jgi:serine phosphatase RsbU (regulator of sigma subunit)